MLVRYSAKEHKSLEGKRMYIKNILVVLNPAVTDNDKKYDASNEDNGNEQHNGLQLNKNGTHS